MNEILSNNHHTYALCIIMSKSIAIPSFNRTSIVLPIKVPGAIPHNESMITIRAP